jgi:subtilisin family serine protease
MENNMKKALPFKKINLASLVLLSVLVFSVFIGISAVPSRIAAISMRDASPMPEEYQELFPDIKPTTSRQEPWEKIAANLDSYLSTGAIPDELRSVDGALEIAITASRYTDLVGLSEHMKIVNVITAEVGLLIQGFVTDHKAVYAISDYPGVGYVFGNEKRVLNEESPTGPAMDNFRAREIMGIDLVDADFPGLNGTGTIIGIVDTGVDFGVTDLVDAIALDSSGYPMSFDPGGSGIAITTYALPSVGGYLLTEGLDFRMFRDDGAMWWSNSTYGIYAHNMYVGTIPSASGFYKVGMSVQIANEIPVPRAFFIYLLTDSVTPFVYDTLYVDLDTSWVETANYGGYSAGAATADWSFTDEAAHMFDSNQVIARDFDGDGLNDYSMGSLSNTFDLTGQITGGLLSGIDTQGRGFAFMFDNGGHGTSCAGTAAGRGIAQFDVYGNGTLYTVPGAAPGAKIMALKTFTIIDELWTWYWGCGYRPAMGYDWFNNWTYMGGPDYQADILSNSWGWSNFHEGTRYDNVNSYDLYSMTVDYLTFYSDTLFCISTGNTGPGYGSVSRPDSIYALMVGASTSYDIWQGFYSNYSQGYDTIADFTSVGPTPQGYLGIDILAVGAYAFDIIPLHGGDGEEAWTIFGGTSQACPFAAGIAALVEQATSNAIPADFNRAYLMNTADDLGFDVYRQGAGRINAYRAVYNAMGMATDGYGDPTVTIFSDVSWYEQYWGDRSDPWRGWYMNMYYSGGYFGYYFDYTELYHMSWTMPNVLVDGAAFPGPVYRGDSMWFNVTGGDAAQTTDFDSLDAYTYALFNESSANLRSTSTYTTFNLTEAFDAIFMGQFMAAEYVTIHLTYPQANLDQVYGLSNQANYVFLHDWVEDNNSNGVIDFEGVGVKGEVRRVASDTAYGNSHLIPLGNPGMLFMGDPTIYYHDVGVELFLWRSLDVNVTIKIWERVPWTWITTSQYPIADPSYPWGWNVTLDVPGATMPGFYEGFLEASIGTGVAHLPVSFRVEANMTQPGMAGAVSWGGKQDLPFDNGATYGNTQYGYRGQVGDWRYWFVDGYPYPAGTPPSYLFVNVTWMDPDTRLDLYIYYSSYGYLLYDTGSAFIGGRWDGTSTGPTSQIILFDISRPGVASWDYTWMSRGYFGIAVRASNFGGADGATEDIYVTCAYGVDNHPDFPASFTWDTPANWINYTDTTTAMSPLADDDVLVGPEATIHTNWSALVIPEFPSISIQSTMLELLSTVSHQNYGTIEGPVVGGWNPDLNPREDYDYVDLLAGQTVQVQIDFGTWDTVPGGTLTHAGDIDVFIWAPGVAHTYANSLTGPVTASGNNPEAGTFTAPVSGEYTIGLDYYSGPVPMAWMTDVYAFQATGLSEAGLSASLDTSITGTNAAYDIRAAFSTGTSLDADTGFTSVFLSNITVQNFFAPSIDSLTPNGGETRGPDPFTISWTASDPNTAAGSSLSLGETLGFSVEVSNDSGTTWKVITFGTTLTSVVWDPQSAYYGLDGTDQMLVRVNCTDGMFTTSRTSAAVFTVSTPAPVPRPPYELYVVIGVAVIVIVILLVTCLLKRRQTAAK